MNQQKYSDMETIYGVNDAINALQNNLNCEICVCLDDDRPDIDDNNMISMLNLLKTNKTIKSFSMYAGIIMTPNSVIELLSDVLSVNNTIECLMISCKMTKKQTERITCVLKKNTTLTKLDLSDNIISIKASCNLSNMIKNNKNLYYLALSECVSDVKKLIPILSSLSDSNIIELRLAENNLGGSISELIPTISRIQSLYLGCNNLTYGDLMAMSKYLTKTIVLKKLFLDRNDFDSECIKIIIDIISKNKSLIEICTRHCGMTDDLIVALVESLESTQIETADFCRMSILSIDSSHTVINALEKNYTIKNIKLGIDKCFIEPINKILKRNTESKHESRFKKTKPIIE